jgi:hypothetical protein
MNFLKKNPALIIGIVLPFLFIAILLIVAVVVPSLSTKPSHDFLYVTDGYDNYNYPAPYQQYKNKYVVVDGRLALQPLMTFTAPAVPAPAAPTPVPGMNSSQPNMPASTTMADAPILFLYNILTDSSHEISFADADKLALDPGPTSPDGYTVQYKYGNDGVFGLFGGDNSQGFFISKGNAGKRLTGLGEDVYSNNFQLVGWIQ